VEVKTRRCDRYVSPASAVDADKVRHVRAAARYYLSTRDTSTFRTRYDIDSIVLEADQPPRIEHLAGAF